MIKVEDCTLTEYERRRIFTFSGSEREMDRLASIFQQIEKNFGTRELLTNRDDDFYRQFVHSFVSSCQW